MDEAIKKYDFKPGLQVELEIISIADLYKKNKGALTSPHRTNFYQIIWIEKGTANSLIDFQPITIKSNSLFFINKGNIHLFDKKEKGQGHVLLFTDSFFFKNDSDIKFLQSTILFHDLLENKPLALGKKEIRFKKIFDLIIQQITDSTNPFQHDILQNHLHNFLMLADTEKRKQGFKKIPLDINLDYTLLFRDLLESNFSSIKSVSSYADKLNLSEKRLNIATDKVLGKTPKQLIDDRVLLEVKRLLVHSNQTIKQIGSSMGFEEPSYFIKYFRKHAGKTPIEFREAFHS